MAKKWQNKGKCERDKEDSQNLPGCVSFSLHIIITFQGEMGIRMRQKTRGTRVILQQEFQILGLYLPH